MRTIFAEYNPHRNSIDVTNRGNNGHFGNFIDLLFHKYMDYF